MNTAPTIQILAVDDDELWLNWLDLKFIEGQALAPAQVRIQRAFHGQMALDLLDEASQRGGLPDVILSDTNMPVLDGIDFWKHLSLRPYGQIPFVLFFGVSVRWPRLTREDLYPLGLKHIISKEDAMFELAPMLTRLLGGDPGVQNI